MPAGVWIVTLAVLGAVLWADLGTKEITGEGSCTR